MRKLFHDNQLFFKKLLLIVYDIVAVTAAGILALLIRFELEPSQIPAQFFEPYQRYNWIMIVVTLLVFYVFRLYSSLWTYAGAVELMNIVLAGCVVGGFQIVFYALIAVDAEKLLSVIYDHIDYSGICEQILLSGIPEFSCPYKRGGHRRNKEGYDCRWRCRRKYSDQRDA